MGVKQLEKLSSSNFLRAGEFISRRLTPKGGGGGKHHFFSFHICDRAAEDKQIEKKRIKIRLCIPEILHVKV